MRLPGGGADFRAERLPIREMDKERCVWTADMAPGHCDTGCRTTSDRCGVFGQWRGNRAECGFENRCACTSGTGRMQPPDQWRACGTPHLRCADKTTLLRPVILAL